MVPCLDMANHSLTPNAYYEETSTSDVALLLRPAMKVDPGSELTISYGTSKTPAEMLFSYGFTDSSSTTSGLTLSIEPFPDDPLGKAKLAIFPGPPIVRIFTENDLVRWESAFIYLLCLNEEDGLEFKVLQQTDGVRETSRTRQPRPGPCYVMSPFLHITFAYYCMLTVSRPA